MRKTTPEEIEQLYQFTRKHYVEYYDVQTELVDHLACAMDENWEKEPGLSFEDNLQREFRSFGVFGFSEVVEKKSRILEKRYFRLIWREMRKLFSVPWKMFLIILTFSGILLLLKYGNPFFIAALVLCFFAILLNLMVRTSREMKRKKKSGEKMYLLEVFILNTGGYFSISYLPFQIFYFSDLSYSEAGVQIITALVFSLLLLSAFVCLYVLPRKKDELLMEQYPELKILRKTSVTKS